ncbi:L10-interacting MYB domain-containing protein [Bienertia sinuspersici]
MAASSSKDGTKGIFKWNIENMVVLCDVCLKFFENNGRNTHFKWKEIQAEVEKKVGCVFTNSNSCKHKYDTMRKDWRNWKDLKSSETGLGWNPVTGKIDASDEWWQRKIKENPEFRKFCQKGVNSTLEERWNNLFGDSYATGKNAFAASLDPDINVKEHGVEYEDFGEDDARILGSNNYFHCDEFTTELINEDNFFENFLEQAQNSTLENRSGASHMINEGPSSSNLASKRVQKQHLTKNKNSQMKRKGRQ